MISRYSNPEISSIWEKSKKFAYWLEIEVAVCEAWHRRGVIPLEDMQNIKKKASFQVESIDAIEAEVHHDMIAFLTNLKENIGPSGRYVHYGLTSSDVGDTALALQLKHSSAILLQRLEKLLGSVKKQACIYKKQVIVGRTHGVHGEPTTLGLKLAHFYGELDRNIKRFEQAQEEICVGKFSGAVGTYSMIDPEIEIEVCEKLGLEADLISTQVINRDRHAYFSSILGLIAGSLEHMAQEIRLLQKTEGREVEEPFVKGQKGSSAMPHKRNPVICERICGITRVIQANVQVAYRNMPLWHERDISHSSAERIILPDSIIALEYILTKMEYVISNLHVYPENMDRTLQTTRGLIFSQRLMLSLVEKGMQREEAYACVQDLCMKVWEDRGLYLHQEAKKDERIKKYFSDEELEEIFSMDYYLRNVDKIYERLGFV